MITTEEILPKALFSSNMHSALIKVNTFLQMSYVMVGQRYSSGAANMRSVCQVGVGGAVSDGRFYPDSAKLFEVYIT